MLFVLVMLVVLIQSLLVLLLVMARRPGYLVEWLRNWCVWGEKVGGEGDEERWGRRGWVDGCVWGWCSDWVAD